MFTEQSKANQKQLIIEAYEAILTKKRLKEMEILNVERSKEYEKNRKPMPNWYALKSTEFSKELYRNRVALKPNNENDSYLDMLLDPRIY